MQTKTNFCYDNSYMHIKYIMIYISKKKNKKNFLKFLQSMTYEYKILTYKIFTQCCVKIVF